MNDNNLNDQSALRKLGYSTSITREERWQILVNKAIPILGIYKTKSFIKWLINIKQADTTKDNSRAIGEWEYDLSRLNQKYR